MEPVALAAGTVAETFAPALLAEAAEPPLQSRLARWLGGLHIGFEAGIGDRLSRFGIGAGALVGAGGLGGRGGHGGDGYAGDEELGVHIGFPLCGNGGVEKLR